MSDPSADLLASVVVPVRNDGRRLRALIEALASQTLARERFEVLVGDDGSTDGSTEGLATDDGWVRVLSGPPANSYAARNRAAAAARSPVLAFCDSDCLPDPTWLEAGLKRLEEADVVGGMIRFSAPAKPTLWTLLDVDSFLDQERALEAGFGATANLFVRTDFFRRLGGFDGSLPNTGDYDFVARSSADGASLVFAPEAAVLHPTRDNARAFLRKIWSVHRQYAAREARSGRRPRRVRARTWLPVAQQVVTRRRYGRSLRLDRRRLAENGLYPRLGHDLRALPVMYLLLPYLANVAEMRGWREGRRLRHQAPTGRPVRLASFPRLETSMYQRLLYDQLSGHGVELVEDARFKLAWLWANRASVELLHFHWPERYYRRPRLSWLKLGYFATRLVTARLLGYRLAWTIHQVYPHEIESPRLERLAGKLLARESHVLFAHDEETAALARAELGKSAATIEIIPLGSFGDAYPRGRDRESVREELGIPSDAFVFLCFGRIRAYKGIHALIEAFAATSLPHCVLVVAGRPLDERSAEAVEAAAAADARIKPLLRFIPDAEVAELFEAADVAIIPRSEGGTSGSLVLALSLGVPAIAPSQPAYEELIGDEAAGWFFRAGDSDSLRAALERAAAEPDVAERKGAVAVTRAQGRDWASIGSEVAADLRRALPEHSRGGSTSKPNASNA